MRTAGIGAFAVATQPINLMLLRFRIAARDALKSGLSGLDIEHWTPTGSARTERKT
jgi:hypothetical protein